MVVIRGFLGGILLDELIDGSRTSDRENTERLYNEIGSLELVDEYVKERWGEVGYKNFHLYDENKRLGQLDLFRSSGIGAHVDDIFRSWMPVVAQLSICTSGHRTFMAERLDDAFLDIDGNFDYEGYKQFACYGGALSLELSEGRVPRSSADLLPGDVAIFAQQPVVNLHSVRSEKGSTARLFNWFARSSKP